MPVARECLHLDHVQGRAASRVVASLSLKYPTRSVPHPTACNSVKLVRCTEPGAGAAVQITSMKFISQVQRGVRNIIMFQNLGLDVDFQWYLP